MERIAQPQASSEAAVAMTQQRARCSHRQYRVLRETRYMLADGVSWDKLGWRWRTKCPREGMLHDASEAATKRGRCR